MTSTVEDEGVPISATERSYGLWQLCCNAKVASLQHSQVQDYKPAHGSKSPEPKVFPRILTNAFQSSTAQLPKLLDMTPKQCSNDAPKTHFREVYSVFWIGFLPTTEESKKWFWPTLMAIGCGF